MWPGGEVALPSFAKGQDLIGREDDAPSCVYWGGAFPLKSTVVSFSFFVLKEGLCETVSGSGGQMALPSCRKGTGYPFRGGGRPFLFALGRCLAMAEYSGFVFTVWRFMLSYCHKLHKFGGGGVWWVMVAGGCGGQWVVLFGGGGGG